jgi:hypothetical protein
MRKFTKAVLLGATLIVAAAAAPSLYAENAPKQAQSRSTNDQGMMGNGGQHGMMGGGNNGQQGMMGGNAGMNGMMNMMTQMSKMMETCNTMMQSHMDHHGGDQPNGQKQAPATPNKG